MPVPRPGDADGGAPALGPVPDDNRPGHHPDAEQDRPDPDAMAEALGVRGDRSPRPADPTASTGCLPAGVLGVAAKLLGTRSRRRAAHGPPPRAAAPIRAHPTRDDPIQEEPMTVATIIEPTDPTQPPDVAPSGPDPAPIIPDPDPNPNPAPIIPDPNPNPDPAPIIPGPDPT